MSFLILMHSSVCDLLLNYLSCFDNGFLYIFQIDLKITSFIDTNITLILFPSVIS